MATELKDYVVVTFSDNGYVHAYGPYIKKEALRIKRQMDTRYKDRVHSFARKIITGTEVDVRPVGSRG